MSPEANAAGRLGIFRIIYALFYLWYLSANRISYLSSLPADAFRQTILLSYFLPKPLPALIASGLEFCLVAALIMLLCGSYTQLSTLAVMVSGCLLEACYSSVDHELGMVFLVFYIPLFMLVAKGWGDTYSVDQERQRQRNGRVDPSSAGAKYSLPINALFLMLSILFLSSFIFKVLGSWLDYPKLISNLVLERNIRAAIYQLPLNGLAPFISTTPVAYHSLRIMTLAFEGSFIVATFCKRLRHVYCPLALIFHAFNAIWLNVTFTPILILYGLFVDWRSMYRGLLRRPVQAHSAPFQFRKVSLKALIYAPIGCAICFSVLWNTQIVLLRPWFNLGGLINWHTIWYPVLPLSTVWLLMGIGSLFSKQTIEGAKT